ncbi:MAG: putative sulfate exporter family transporter [Alistipes putredinis]
MKKSLIRQLKSEDWVIVGAGAAILLLALLFPRWMPAMPKDLSSAGNWMSAGAMFLFLLVLTGVCQRILGRPLRRFAVSLLAIFGVALLSQAVASIPAIKRLGFEAVFFSVIFGLVISNFFRVPEWLKPAIQSEFYIKIGIVCLGATILFGEVLQSGVYALIQAFIVVFTVWYFAFWLARRMRVDEETSTMLASSVSICGVSAAIATCGVIRGDNKKLSYIISLVLVCAVPMMYLMPWLAGMLLPTVLSNPETVQEVAGAWMGGTIDTTGAVVASGALLGETAEQTAIIVKSSQNVLLGIAAFVISLYWSYKGQNKRQRPSVRVIWERFPKFVVGFVAVSLLFSLFFAGSEAAPARTSAKMFSNTLFSIAFVCIGLETRFRDIFSKENRRTFWAFMTAQMFNIVVTLIVAYLLFGVLKPYLN